MLTLHAALPISRCTDRACQSRTCQAASLNCRCRACPGNPCPQQAPGLSGEARCRGRMGPRDKPEGDNRSEEHTSELQSLMRISYAVFCLKKKTQNKTQTSDTHIHFHTHSSTRRY